MVEARFEIVQTTRGAMSIRDGRVGEIMHNPLGPWREIQELYLGPARLAERLQALPSSQEFILYDVGLGAGANAMAALLLAQSTIAQRANKIGFRLISFERDLSLAHFAVAKQKHFPEFANAWSTFQSLLEAQKWQHPALPVCWEVHCGDFMDCLEEDLPKADLIFYDPYSPKKNPEMWTYAIFKKLHRFCHPESDRPGLLLTYSRATSVRAALLLAGFYVGQGKVLGEKEETTQAATQSHILDAPLGRRWLERWQRSPVDLPQDLKTGTEIEQHRWRQCLLEHPQFKEINFPN